MVALLVLFAGCTAGSTTTLTADLSGTEGAPDERDPDGSGSATIDIDEENDEVCWEITVENVDNVTAAHIHRGASGESGPVVVPLSAPEGGSSEGCTDAESDIISELMDNPSEFYVNVHNDEFPDGAVRGQLSS